MRKIFPFICIIFVFANSVAMNNEKKEQIKKSIASNAMTAGAIGDALGRVTELKKYQDIFNIYSNGVRTFADFVDEDWANVPYDQRKQTIAPYTDDTRMALLVMKALIETQKKSYDLNKTMENIAHEFVNDNGTYGWQAGYRAPGNACIAGVDILRQKIKQKIEDERWWDVQKHEAGGCGSVMRAHPFGIIFYDEPEKAEGWAVEHSKLTHGHPMALAACAAMATGIAYAMQDKDWDFIFKKMIKSAEKYDQGTADKMKKAIEHAQATEKIYSGDILNDLNNKDMQDKHCKVFSMFEGWRADDAIAGVVYAVALAQNNKNNNKIMEAIYIGVHTEGDSDSIASMAGALMGAKEKNEKLPYALVNKIEDSELLRGYDNKQSVKKSSFLSSKFVILFIVLGLSYLLFSEISPFKVTLFNLLEFTFFRHRT